MHIQRVGFKAQSCQLLVRDFVLTLHFLGLSFLISKVGPIMVPVLQESLDARALRRVLGLQPTP